MVASSRSGPLLCPHCRYPVDGGGHYEVRQERSLSPDPAAAYTDREVEVVPVYYCESSGGEFAHQPYTMRKGSY